MNMLPFKREKDNVYVACATGEVEVHRTCSNCTNCKSIQIGMRMMPSPYDAVLTKLRAGKAEPEQLMEAAVQFNALVRDGTGLGCADDSGKGYTRRF
jgi:hypothetical protein